MEYRKRATIIAVVLALSEYLVFQYTGFRGMASYFIPPAITALIVAYLAPKTPRGVPGDMGIVYVAATVLGIRVFVDVVAGMFSGFSVNPSTIDAASILILLYYRGMYTAGMEVSRSLATGPRAPWLRILAVSAVYTLLYVNIAEYVLVSGTLGFLKFLDSRIAPLFLENVFLTMLASMGGLRASMTYALGSVAYMTLVPLMPDTSWIVSSYIGLLIPAAGILLLYSVPSTRILEPAENRGPGLRSYLWAPLIVALVLLSSGAVGYRPYAIASTSMEPTISRGDAVIVKLGERSLGKGDIAAFSMNGRVVVHRIYGVRDGVYTTKGDALNDTDPWSVSKEAVIGKVVASIPYLGLPSLYLPVLLESRMLQALLLASLSLMLYLYARKKRRW